MSAPRARKRFGQHFLTDSFVLNQIASAIALRATDRVFEIGPGRGALTDVLYGDCEHYRAVEIDRDLIEELGQRFPALDLTQGDILEVPLATLLADGPWRVVGNLPYNISTPLLERLFEQLDQVRDIHVMLQKEVADRLAAQPGTKAYGRLSVGAQVRAEIVPLFDVPPESFTPPPAVNSAVLRLLPLPASQRLPAPVAHALDRCLRLAFQQRRKRLSNALKSLAIDFAALDLDPALRADQVSVAAYVQLAQWLAVERGELLRE
ncbi:MAG: 16S rRNA (adenine(1518)-N(6)/adenine(1519)-N(6))-dimethyltransferase RsmA [Pseudomonadales bacterium]